VTLASATNAFTVWRRSGGDAARTGTCARNGCTNTFERYNAQTRYCSDRCAWNADNDRRRQREQEASRRTVECGVCGTPFETTRDDRRYCGEKCGNVARTRRKRATAVTATERAILTDTNPESTLASTQPGEDAA
jgi:predicted nucleic acid-binding Zn ribbon protein